MEVANQIHRMHAYTLNRKSSTMAINPIKWMVVGLHRFMHCKHISIF